jgi:hypothetical protein
MEGRPVLLRYTMHRIEPKNQHLVLSIVIVNCNSEDSDFYERFESPRKVRLLLNTYARENIIREMG